MEMETEWVIMRTMGQSVEGAICVSGGGDRGQWKGVIGVSRGGDMGQWRGF